MNRQHKSSTYKRYVDDIRVPNPSTSTNQLIRKFLLTKGFVFKLF